MRPLSSGFSGADGVRTPSAADVLGRRRRNAAVVVARRRPRRLTGTWLVLGFFAAATYVGLSEGGYLQAFQEQNGTIPNVIAREVGLGIDRVTISGLSQLHVAEVLTTANVSPKGSLAFLDAAGARERLEKMPLVKSATVRKLYPNELIVAIEERQPHAVWQSKGELFVIAADGTVIDRMKDARFLGLPFVVGEYANERTKEYIALLNAAGSLKTRIRAGTLVSGRRWTLKMDNGLDIRLPETGAVEAVARLAKLQQERRILEKDVLAIDLRMPDRVVVRLSEEAAAVRMEAQRKKLTRGRGVET